MRRLGLVGALGLLAFPAVAQADVLYDQTADPPSTLIISNDWPGPDNRDAQAADDFTLPPGGPWQIQSFYAIGAGGDSTFTGNVVIYADTGTGPGTEIFNQSGIPLSGSDNFSFAVTGAPSLGPGSYWVSLQTNSPGSLAWSWDSRTQQTGHEAVWRNPGGAFGPACASTTYRTFTTCGFAPAKDLLFRVSGVGPASPIPSNQFALGKVTRKPNGTATIAGAFPGAGAAVVQDAKTAAPVASASKTRKPLIKTKTVPVAGASTVALPVRPTKAAKKRLRKGRKVKVTALVTYTPVGGSAASRTKNVRLKWLPPDARP